jgi:hypothetical protein
MNAVAIRLHRARLGEDVTIEAPPASQVIGG